MSLSPMKKTRSRNRRRLVPSAEGLEQRALLAKFVLAPSGGLGSTASLVSILPGVPSAVGTELLSDTPTPGVELAKVVTDLARMEDHAVTYYHYWNFGDDEGYVNADANLRLVLVSSIGSVSFLGEPTVTATGEIGTSRTGSASNIGTPITYRIEPTEGEVLGEPILVSIGADFGAAGGRVSQVEYSVSYSLGESGSRTILSGSSLELKDTSSSFVARIGDEVNLSMLLRASATWPGENLGGMSASPILEVRMKAVKLPDIEVSRFGRTDDGGIFYRLDISGGSKEVNRDEPIFAEDYKAAVFWAKGPNAADVITGAAPVWENEFTSRASKRVGSYPLSGAGFISADQLNLANRPSDATHLVFVADSGGQVVESDEGNNTASVYFGSAQTLPDIKVVNLAWNGDDGGVDYSVEVTGSDLVVDADVGLYWAKGLTVDDILSRAFGQQTVKAVGSYGPFHVTKDQFESIPEGATHILAVADRFGFFGESDEGNNVLDKVIPIKSPAGLSLSEADFAGTPLQGAASRFQFEYSFNIPGSDVRSFVVALYRSRDDKFDPGVDMAVEYTRVFLDGDSQSGIGFITVPHVKQAAFLSRLPFYIVVIDPEGDVNLDSRRDDNYKVLSLKPRTIEVRFQGFIPSPAVQLGVENYEPGRPTLVFGGDNRGYQYDASKYRFKQNINVSTDSMRRTSTVGMPLRDWGPTTAYLGRSTARVPGAPSWWLDVLPGKRPYIVGQLQVNNYNSRVFSRKINTSTTRVTMIVNGGNPLAPGAPEINARVVVDLAYGERGALYYKVYGRHDGFPAYELYLDGMLAYGYNPRDSGVGPLFGLAGIQFVNIDGGVYIELQE